MQLMKGLEKFVIKLSLILISAILLLFFNDYIKGNNENGRYVPFSYGRVLDTKTGAVYRPNGAGKEMKLLGKPVSNK